MKKTFMLMILGLVLISGISAVSAMTIVAGKIYDSPDFENAHGIGGAFVNVSCDHGGIITSKNTTSVSDGTYSVSFENSVNECALNDQLKVYASHPDYGFNSEEGVVSVDMRPSFDIRLGVVNIALVPEFGFYVGALTLMGALGLFFLVRRK